jgi:hypothetical protein
VGKLVCERVGPIVAGRIILTVGAVVGGALAVSCGGVGVADCVDVADCPLPVHPVSRIATARQILEIILVTACPPATGPWSCRRPRHTSISVD